MPVHDRSDPDGYERVDGFEGGLGWLVHPDETNRRASHALACREGVVVLDPLDAPGLDDLLAELGEVAGVAVCSAYHARDAGRIAGRHGVPVLVPAWMGRVSARVEGRDGGAAPPVERFDGRVPGTDLRVLRCEPFPGWSEAMLYRERDGTLYVPDSLGTTRLHRAGDERLGLNLARRLQPPRSLLGDLAPERVLVGHGEGVFEDATAALETALATARRRFPRAALTGLPGVTRAFVSALRE